MTGEQAAGIARALVAAIGGYLVSKGIVDANTVSAVGGGLATVAAAVWSVWSKRDV